MKDNLFTILQNISEESKSISVFSNSVLGIVHDVIQNIFIERSENQIDISGIGSSASISIDLNNIESVEDDYDYASNAEIVRIIGEASSIEIHY